MKKEIKRARKLELHRESLRDLDLRGAAAGAAQPESRTDITFVYTGCVTLCHTTTR